MTVLDANHAEWRDFLERVIMHFDRHPRVLFYTGVTLVCTFLAGALASSALLPMIDLISDPDKAWPATTWMAVGGSLAVLALIGQKLYFIYQSH